MSSLIIFDTSVLVDRLRAGMHRRRMESLFGIIRNSSVVLSELWRGSRSRYDHVWLVELEKNHPVLTPTTRNWLESGQVLAKIRDDNGFEAGKLRDLHFDVLIALTARSNGARLITSNRADFELIRRYRPFPLEIWSPAV
jgi:predicted nucleic acid-binding protein